MVDCGRMKKRGKLRLNLPTPPLTDICEEAVFVFVFVPPLTDICEEGGGLVWTRREAEGNYMEEIF